MSSMQLVIFDIQNQSGFLDNFRTKSAGWTYTPTQIFGYGGTEDVRVMHIMQKQLWNIPIAKLLFLNDPFLLI